MPALGRDIGQWSEQDPSIAAWFATLMQPDNPHMSCCGQADGYWADQVNVIDGQVIATITDTRDDAPLMRQHVPAGTKIVIPPNKLKFDRGNPVGHAIVFLSVNREVYCFVQDSGA